MQMGYDFTQALPLDPARTHAPALRQPAEAGTGGEPVQPVHPEWTSLRARFLALHALRRVVPAAVEPARPAGGFAAAGESVLSACRSAGAVNPLYWANLKDDSGNTSPVAASPTRGDRGMA